MVVFFLINTLNLPRRAPHSTFLRLLAVQKIRYLPLVFGMKKHQFLYTTSPLCLLYFQPTLLLKEIRRLSRPNIVCARGHFPISTFEPV